MLKMLPAEKLNVFEFWPGTDKNFPIALSELGFGLSEPVNDAFVDGILFCWSSATRNGVKFGAMIFLLSFLSRFSSSYHSLSFSHQSLQQIFFWCFCTAQYSTTNNKIKKSNFDITNIAAEQQKLNVISNRHFIKRRTPVTVN